MSIALSIAILLFSAGYVWLGGWWVAAVAAGAVAIIGIAQSVWDMEPLLRLATMLSGVVAAILLIYNLWTVSLPGFSGSAASSDPAFRNLLFIEFLTTILVFARSARAL